MNRTRRNIGTVLHAVQAGGIAAVLVLVAGTPLAHGQNAPATSQTSPTQTPSTAPSSGSPSTTPPSAQSSNVQPPAATATGSSSSAADSASGQSPDAKSDAVCFKLTGHCVDSSKANGTSAPKPGTATAKSGAKGKKLNLTAPDVSTVVPEQELKEPLPNENQITEVQEAQTVAVRTDEGVPPDVPQGLGAIWWAVVHPSQAWRILTPYE